MQACNVTGGTGQKGAGKGKGKFATGAWGVQQPAFMKGGYGKAFGGDQGKGKDGKSKSGGKGHLLPRTRISEAPFSGEVVKWSGKYGFIQPSETIEHEKAEEAAKEEEKEAEEKQEEPVKDASPLPVPKEATPEVASKEGSQEVEELPNNEEVREKKIITSEEEAKVSFF